MNNFNKLKLAVYESRLEWDEKNELIAVMESCSDDDLNLVCTTVESLITEGATIDTNKVFKEFKNKVPKLVKEARNDYKNAKYDDAIEKLTEAKEYIVSTERKLNAIDVESIGAIACGSIYRIFLNGLKSSLIGLVTFGIGKIVYLVKSIAEQLSGVIEIFNDKKTITPDMLNVNYTQIKGIVSSTEKTIDKLIKEIEDIKKEEEKKEEKKSDK